MYSTIVIIEKRFIHNSLVVFAIHQERTIREINVQYITIQRFMISSMVKPCPAMAAAVTAAAETDC